MLPDRACPLVTREPVYTAGSRARAAVVVCGSLEILAAGIATRAERGSGIAQRLAGARDAAGV